MLPSIKFQRSSTHLECLTTADKEEFSVKKSETENENSSNLSSHSGNLSSHSGVQTREFYESLFEESGSTKCSNPNKKCDKISKRDEQMQRSGRYIKKKDNHLNRKENLFLKMAQNGDIDGLQSMIENSYVNINTKDQYGWTALMCATASAKKDCIKFLLDHGANTALTNSQGQTAMDIARIVKIPDVFVESKSNKRCKIKSSSHSMLSQHCDICNTKFKGSKHNTSTAHLFNLQYKKSRTFYCIPENNIGFKLMKQKGWDQEKGLGPKGSGRKFPVKTVLKQDREGLGYPTQLKARVTHFQAQDTRAVKHNEKKKQQLRKQKNWKQKHIEKREIEKRWEHNLRIYMNTE